MNNDEVTADVLYKIFPGLKEVNEEVPRMINKCTTVSYRYLEKHRELIVLFDRYKRALDRFVFLQKKMDVSIDMLRAILTDIGTEGINEDLMAKFKAEQEILMSEYHNIRDEMSSKFFLNFDKAYKNIERDTDDIFDIIQKTSTEISEKFTINTSEGKEKLNIQVQKIVTDLNKKQPVTASSTRYSEIIKLSPLPSPPDTETPTYHIVLIYPDEQAEPIQYTYRIFDLSEEDVPENYK